MSAAYLGAEPPSSPTEHLPITITTYNVQTHPELTLTEQNEKFLRSNTEGLNTLFALQPDLVGLQEIPLGGIQWLQKQFGQSYEIVYAPKRAADNDRKINDYTAILFKKSRFSLHKRENANPRIKTYYFNDNTGNLALSISLQDLVSGQDITFLNTHITGGEHQTLGDAQVKEIVQLSQKHPYMILSANFNASKEEPRMQILSRAGFVLDPATGATVPAKNQKFDFVLYKANQRSKFLSDNCKILSQIKGSEHLPLTCSILFL